MKLLTLTPRKPLTYLPGLITLLFFPVGYYIYVVKHNASRLNYIDVYASRFEYGNHLPSTDNAWIPAGNYSTFELTGDSIQDNFALISARYQLQDLQRSKDTVNGIAFHFGKKAQYWTYAVAWELFRIERAKASYMYDDRLYISFKPVKQISEPRIVEVISFVDDTLGPRERAWRKAERIIPALLKKYWAPGILLMLTMFFALRNLFLNFKQQTNQ